MNQKYPQYILDRPNAEAEAKNLSAGHHTKNIKLHNFIK